MANYQTNRLILIDKNRSENVQSLDASRLEIINALKNNEFVLYYQPQFNIKTKSYVGVEALIRWQHREKGLLFPADFLPLAEAVDLMRELDQWVLNQACQQNKLWQMRGMKPIRIAVNISPKFIQSDDFANSIVATLNKTQLKPEYLELEITEEVDLHHNEKVIDSLHTLKSFGIKIALDDFGTGYSSISYLKKLPIDRIKIDKSFIQNILENPNDAAMVIAMISLASSMNIEIIAEGVETLKQLQTLLAHDCHEIQGFYFSKALPVDEVEILLFRNQLFNLR